MSQEFGSLDEALQRSRTNYRGLGRIIRKQEKKIQFLETKTLSVAMFYVASQLAILVANSKPNPYQCRNWWRTFLISISISITFALNFTTTVIKYIQTTYEQERNVIDQNENYRQMLYVERRASRIKTGETSAEFDVPEECIQPQQQRLKPDMFAVYARYTHLGVTASALLAFTLLVLQTSRSSVCAGRV